MRIDRAIFREGRNEEVVTLETITSHADYITVKENLYCATSECNCRLVFVPEGVKVAHFKKWKGYDHVEDCPYFRETIMGAKSFRIVGKNISRLRDGHVKNVLNDTFDRFNETEEERVKRLERQNSNSRKRRNKVIERQDTMEFEDVFMTLPSTSLSVEEVKEGDRNPTVKKRMSVADFVFSDIGLTISTVGYLREVHIEEKYSLVIIVDKHEHVYFPLYLEEFFYENSSLNIRPMIEGLKKLYEESEDEIIVTVIGEVVFRGGQFGMIVMDEKKLSFNRMRLAGLIVSRTTLF
ncbi:hypothetical protein H9649_15390 [Sporosarcina sp. Sa2YVA2]|uniref:Uncharacterized protein n=1 Tax=Sporosarcina quadrami TaxID=2762234 RepID=A0ABR8UE31_9BACL|nr:hypothetical protein [Sporosarcina quadrami]MBD7985954.1 hypothetical protein [Sporosarcina quadrami]